MIDSSNTNSKSHFKLETVSCKLNNCERHAQTLCSTLAERNLEQASDYVPQLDGPSQTSMRRLNFGPLGPLWLSQAARTWAPNSPDRAVTFCACSTLVHFFAPWSTVLCTIEFADPYFLYVPLVNLGSTMHRLASAHGGALHGPIASRLSKDSPKYATPKWIV
jgi:hypothetical protein